MSADSSYEKAHEVKLEMVECLKEKEFDRERRWWEISEALYDLELWLRS